MGMRHVYLGGDSSTGTEIIISQDSFTLNESLGYKSTFSFTIENLNSATLNPGVEVTFYDDTTYLWGGSVKEIIDESPGANRIIYHVTAEDYNELVERVLIIKGFENYTIEDMVKYLISNFFSSYGITEGTISATTVINKVPFNYVYGHSALNHLRDFGNYVWNIDKNKKLHFQQIGYSVSSTTINDASLTSTINAFRRKRDLENYRNRQYTKGSDRLSILQENKTPTPTPNSSNREFFVKYRIGLEPTIEVNRGSGWVEEDVGIKGLHEGSGAKWWWSYGSTQITQDESETALSASHQIRVTYYGLIPLIVVAQKSSEITEKGVYDAYEYNGKLQDTIDGLKYSYNLLDKYANEADTLSYTMYTKEYEIGQQVPVLMSTLRTIDETFLVHSCTWYPRGVDKITYQYELIDSPNVGGWEDFFKNLIEASKISVDINEVIIFTKQISESMAVSGEYTFTMLTPLYPATDLYPSTSLTPGTIDSTDTVSD